MINFFFYSKRNEIWSLRLSVRTRGFHPRKRGSIPLGTATFMIFYVYMLKSVNNKITRSYVGYTNNLHLRLKKHNSSKGAKSTRGYKWKIIYKKRFYDKRQAMSFEYHLKKDRKKRKYLLENN